MHIKINEDYNVVVSTALLGYVGETNARPVSFEGLTVDGADRYVLTIDYGDGVEYEVDITGGQWTPTADILRAAQTVSCQICAKKLSGQEYILVKKSRIFRLRIGAAIGDNAVPSPDVSMDALDRIDAIGRQAHADMQTAVTAAETATTAANNAAKSATDAGLSADTATQAAERAETAKTATETSATQADTAKQGAETARAEAVTSQNAAKISAAQASTAAQQTEADKTITAGYAKTAKTCADSTTADRQAVQTLAEQVTADKANVAENAAKVAEDRTAAETAAQTAQAVADSLPDDYTTAVGKIAENTAEISAVKLTDKELTRRVDALYDMGNGVTHRFETDTDTAYAKTVPTGGKLMSVKSVGGKSVVWNQIIKTNTDFSNTVTDTRTYPMLKIQSKDKNNITITLSTFNYESLQAKRNGFISKVLQSGSGIYILHNGSKNDIPIYSDQFGQIVANHTYYFSINLKSVDPTTIGGLQCNNLMLIDLTTMFGAGNEPSTAEEFEKMFPADYYPYCAGEIVSAGTEEVVEQGKNLWDLESYTASDLIDLGTGYWGVKLNVKPNSAYCISVARDTALCGTYGKVMGADKRNIDFFGHKTTDALNAYTGHPITFQTADEDYVYVTINSYTGFDTWESDFQKYFPNFQIEESSTATAYTPYHRNAYPIPEAIKSLPGYGWSAGTARNYADYENKKYYQCVQSVDLGTLNWKLNTTSGVGQHFYTVVDRTKFKYLGVSGTTVHNILCSKYQTVARSANVFVDKTITLDGTGIAISQIQVKDTAYTDATTFKQAMQGVILYYELATPIITDISDLIPDDFLRNIEVEAGGSITFKGGNDDYRIPVPSELEYIVKLSEVGGSV